MKVLLGMLFFFSFILQAQANSSLPLRGQGDYKWFFLSIYDATLWAEEGRDFYNRPLLLELKYARSFKGKDIADQSIKELKSAGLPSTELDRWRIQLLEIFPDVKEGDSIKASYYPKNGIAFYLNSQQELGQITDLNFSKSFLDIWLGEKSSAPELRKKLLGEKI